MMWMRTRMSLGLAAVVAAGCAGPRTTLTQGEVNLRTANAVLGADRTAAAECDHRRVASTEIVQAPDVVVVPARPNSQAATTTPDAVYPIGFGAMAGGRGDSKHIERWTVDRCGTMIRYLVAFSADGKGGTVISVKPE